jgi:beta-glucosidase
MTADTPSPDLSANLPDTTKDHTRPIAERVKALVDAMTLEEKALQMVHSAPAIERLGIPKYNWWNECLHGVGRAGIATVFPQSIGMAATWNTDLLHEVATVISDEARAKHHDALRRGVHDIYYGLTFWTPNINIFRDPRWGRGQETYGEDPYLTSRFGVTFIKGLQGDDPRYLKVAACAKHYAVHSGPENIRHHFDAVVSDKDLWETYLPAFEASVKEAKVEIVMGAYNRTNGEPCCASTTLLDEILRQKWGFDGHVVSDCWAIVDIFEHHQVVATREEAAALAVKNGCDVNCGCTFDALVGAVEQGLIDEATIDQALSRLFTTRMRLGMFDPPEIVPYAQIPIEVNDAPEHRQLALKTARESMVLLKNKEDFLPLSKNIKTIAVIGPNADDPVTLLGNYNGEPSSSTTPLAGIKATVSAATEVLYAEGCKVAGKTTSGYDEAVAIAEKADVVIFVGGLSQWLEGEEGATEAVPEGEKGQADRTELDLPDVQEALLKKLHATGTPVVLVLMNGSAVAVNWADNHISAILEAWYPGEEGGQAIAEVLFGDVNPGGRLPVTFYRSLDDLPAFDDYDMDGHTYRFFRGASLFPFGFGLSYTTFEYKNLRLDRNTIDTGQSVTVSIDVQNTGQRDGDEVVQLYLSDVEASVRVPIHQLRGFTRIHLKAGEMQTVNFELQPADFALVDVRGRRVVEPGQFRLFVGGGQPHVANGLRRNIDITGRELVLA